MSAAPDSETAPAPGRLLQPPRDPDAKVHHHHHLRMRLPLSEGGCYHHTTTPRIIDASTHIKCVLLLCGELAEASYLCEYAGSMTFVLLLYCCCTMC